MAQKNASPAVAHGARQEFPTPVDQPVTTEPVAGKQATRPTDTGTKPAPKFEVVPPAAEELDEEEKEFRTMRRDLPGVKGASAAGITTISVDKIPGKNAFFRTLQSFRPVVPVVNLEVGMEKQFFAVTDSMVVALADIGITVSEHALYFTLTASGRRVIVPVRQTDSDGVQDQASSSKEIGLLKSIDAWHRLFWDAENKCYDTFPAPLDRFGEPQFPDLKPARIYRLAFRDKGRLIDSPNHPLFLKWSARDQ